MKNYDKLFFGIIESGERESWKVEVFLINPTKSSFKISQEQGSVQSDEDSLLDLGWGKAGSFNLGPKSAHLIDTFHDGGELDFTTTYVFKIKTGQNKVKSKMGSVNGWDVCFPYENEYRRTMEKLPILGVKGIFKRMF